MPYQDGNYPSGAGVLNINATNHKCNSFNTDKSDVVVDVQDENGKHAGALSFGGKTSFTAEVQLANQAVETQITTAEENANLGTFNRDNANWFITGVSKPKPAQGAWVVNVSGQKRVNP